MDPRARQALQRGMERLAGGEREAFSAVFAALWPVLRAVAARLLGDGPLAEDAAQSALLGVFARAHEFDPDRDALSWAVGVVAWECRTLRRRAHRRREEPAGPDFTERAGSLSSPEEEVAFRELCAAAADVLGDLRPANAETLRQVARGDRPAIAGHFSQARRARAVAAPRRLEGQTWRRLT